MRYKIKRLPSSATGKCGVCGGWFLLRRDGMIRYHGPHPSPCPGGGKPEAATEGAGDG